MLVMFLLCCPCQGWPCGDKQIDEDSGKVCNCSGEIITEDDYDDDDKGCCTPPDLGLCEETSEGVNCYNSTIFNSLTQPCNGECFNSRDTVCPTTNITLGTEHQQCYEKSIHNDRKYNCLNRGDEEIITEDIRNIDFSSALSLPVTMLLMKTILVF